MKDRMTYVSDNQSHVMGDAGSVLADSTLLG